MSTTSMLILGTCVLAVVVILILYMTNEHTCTVEANQKKIAQADVAEAAAECEIRDHLERVDVQNAEHKERMDILTDRLSSETHKLEIARAKAAREFKS